MKPRPIGTSTDQWSVSMRATEIVSWVSGPISTVVPGGEGGASVPLDTFGAMRVTPPPTIQLPALCAWTDSAAQVRAIAAASRMTDLFLFMAKSPGDGGLFRANRPAPARG